MICILKSSVIRHKTYTTISQYYYKLREGQQLNWNCGKYQLKIILFGDLNLIMNVNHIRANLKTGASRKQSTPNFPENKHSYPLKCTHTCAYQWVRNIRLSENLTCFVFLGHPFWDSPFALLPSKYSRTTSYFHFFIVCILVPYVF